jgi:hypothetical protein
MNNKITISVGGIIVVLISIFIGYLLGKSSVEIPKPKTEIIVKWEKGKIIRDTIKILEPYEVKVPDSIVVFIPTDTAKLFAIWKDYYLQRKYNLDFSNDTLGTFKVDAVVRQNKIVSATSIIQPNIRTVYEKQTVYKVPMIQFYGIMGVSADLRTNKIQFGADLKQKFMIGVSGMRIENNYGYTIDFGIKF